MKFLIETQNVNGHQTSSLSKYGQAAWNQAVRIENEFLSQTYCRAIILPDDKEGCCTLIFVTPQQWGGQRVEMRTQNVETALLDAVGAEIPEYDPSLA